MDKKEIDARVMARLKAPFGYERVEGRRRLFESEAPIATHFRIHDANDDAIATVSAQEEGYAKLIVDALNAWKENETKAKPERWHIEERLIDDRYRFSLRRDDGACINMASISPGLTLVGVIEILNRGERE